MRPTLEVVLAESPKHLVREVDEETGLALFANDRLQTDVARTTATDSPMAKIKSQTEGRTANAAARAVIRRIKADAYVIPTEVPESDGTLEWDSTTLTTVHIEAAGERGFGYTFSPAATARLIRDELSPLITGRNAFAVEACWQAMMAALRNAGRQGIASAAISAIDVALWDLKARLMGLPLVHVWGAVRESVPLYASGGFTGYDDQQLTEQLGGWAADGFERVKMKVGREPVDDSRRVAIVRRAIGDEVELFVDANGAYGRKQALRFAKLFANELGVVWFEEPCSQDDVKGLRLLRDRGPAGMDIAAGEYGNTLACFRRLLEAGAVDCLQADVTRCGGFTGFFKVASLCDAFHIPLSAHCAAQLHAHIGCCVAPLCHVEYFHDHARIARMLFEGALEPHGGRLQPDVSRPGLGLSLQERSAKAFAVST